MPEKNAKNNPSAALRPFLILLAWATEEEKGPRTAHLEQELGAQSPSMCRLLEKLYGYECHSFNRPYSCNIACKYHYQNHGPHGIADPGGKRFRKYTHRQGIGTRVNIRNPGMGLCSAYEFSVNYLTMSDNCNMIDLVR